MATDPPERELERMLIAAANDPAERPAFSEALISSEVYVLGTVVGDVKAGVVPAGASLQIRSIADETGAITPFFTSETTMTEHLEAHPEADRRFVRLPCRALFEMTRGSRLVLNPDSPYGRIFTSNEVAAFAVGEEPGVQTEVVTAGRRVRVGGAAHIPPALPAVLSRYLVQRPVVVAAHLGWIAHPDGHTGYLMVIEADDREKAMEGFGSLLIGEITEGQTLDVMVVAPGSKHYLSSIPAFYSRQPQADIPETRRRRWRKS